MTLCDWELPFSSQEVGTITLAPIPQAMGQCPRNRVANSRRKELSWWEWNATATTWSQDEWERRIADAMVESERHLLRIIS